MKSKFIMIAAVFILIVTVFLLFELHNSSKKEVIERFSAGQIVAARSLASEIESYLRNRSRGVEVLSSFSVLQYRNMNEMAVTIQEYFEYLEKDHVKAISVYDEKGKIIYSTAKDAIGHVYAEYDFFQWAAKKENRGKQFVSSLIRKIDNQTERLPNFRFLIAASVYQEIEKPQYPKPSHKFMGVVTATIDLKEVLAAFLPKASPYAAKEKVWIMDRDETLLFQPEHPEMVLRNTHLQDKTCRKCHVSFKYVETILNERQGTTEYKLKEGPKKLASFSSVEFKNISWKIVLNLPEEEISGFINKNLMLTFILIGVITLTLIGGSSQIYRNNRLKIRSEEEAKYWKEKRKLENQISESEEMFRRLFEESTDPILLLNQKYFFNCNPAALSILQLKSKDEIENKTPWDLSPEFQPDGKLSSEKAVEMILTAKQNGYHRFEWVHTKKDGSNFFVEVMLTPISLHGEEFFYVVWRDITERKRAEEALRENEERLRTIIETEPECVKVVDRDGQLLEMNAAGLAMLEAESLSAAQQHTLLNFILPEYRAPFGALHKCVMGGENGTLEFEVTGLRGTRRWLETYAAPMRDATGEVTKLLGVTRDITERKRVEEVLRESEERFRNIVENINEVFYISNGQGRILYCSPNIATAIGYSLQEIIGKSFLRLVAPIDRRILLDNYLEQTTKGVSDTALVFRVRCKDGKIIWVEQITHIVRDTLGNVIEYRNVARDITERKRTEEEISMLANALRSVGECVSITDLEDKLLFVNESFVKTYGYSEEELIGEKNMLIVRSPNNPPELVGEILPATLRGGWTGELLNKRKDGSEFPIYLSTTVINDKNGKPLGLIGVAKDITERKRAEQEIISQKK